METKPNPEEYNISFDDTRLAFAGQSDRTLRKKYLVFAAMNNRFLNDLGATFFSLAIEFGLPVKGIIKDTVFEQFCGGENIEESEHTIQELAACGVGTILDYSVEGEKNEEAYEATAEEILRTVEKARTSPHIPFCVLKVTGIARFNLLKKIQRNEELTDREKESLDRLRTRLDRICKAVEEAGVSIFIDGEESWIQDAIDMLVFELIKKYNTKRAVVYNTFQLYRKDGMQLLRKAMHFATIHQVWLGAKLVRGAYMEKERERAVEQAYPDPINATKEATDDLYNQALKYCLDNKQRIALCSGSHNDYSNYYLTLLMEKHGLKRNDPRVYFAQLYGMSDNLSFSLAAHGYNVAKYVPYGPVKYVLPYLIRRAKENSSIKGQSSRELKLIKQEMNRRGIRLYTFPHFLI